MKKFVLIVSMLIILIALIVFLSFTNIGKVVLVNSPFFKEKINIESQDFLKISYENSSANDESNRNQECVTVEVLKDTITPYGASIVINDKNENPYNFEPIFSITKKADNGWIYIPSNVDVEFDIDEHYANGRQYVIKKLDWTETHGKLSAGIYKITFQAKEEEFLGFSSNEFEIY